jgi:AraC-like DNA-binding protein
LKNVSAVRNEADLQPFKDAFARSHLRVADIARETGLEHSYLSRILGKTKAYSTNINDDGSRHRYVYEPKSISEERALLLAEALGL